MHDPDPIPISALQHWAYHPRRPRRPRQCGLIHLEQAFDDNLHTLRGNAVHARVDKPGVDSARGVRTERALPLWHDGLSLIGKAAEIASESSARNGGSGLKPSNSFTRSFTAAQAA